MHPRVSFALFASPVRWKYFSVLLKWGRRRALATRSRWFSSIFVNFFRKKLPPTREYRAVVIDAIKRAVAMRKKEEVSDFVLFFFTLRWRRPTDEEKKRKKNYFFPRKKNVRWGFPSPFALNFAFFSHTIFKFSFSVKNLRVPRETTIVVGIFFSKVDLGWLKMVWNA